MSLLPLKPMLGLAPIKILTWFLLGIKSCVIERFLCLRLVYSKPSGYLSSFQIKAGTYMHSHVLVENFCLVLSIKYAGGVLDQNVTLATIYCPNGNPDLSLFQTINNLSDMSCLWEILTRN